MKAQLLVSVSLYREKFLYEDFIGSDDIFALCGSGSFSVRSGDEVFTICENEGMLFKKDTLYHRTVNEPVTLYLFRYKSDVPLFKKDYVTFSDVSRIKSTISMLDALEKGIYADDFTYRKHLFTDIVNQYSIESGNVSGCSETHDELMEMAAQQIKKCVKNKMSLCEIGKRSGLSYVQFIRRFRAYFGITPTECLKLLRIRRAKELLKETTLPVKKISDFCGFENEYYFSNYFKKNTGMSPTDFRNTTD